MFVIADWADELAGSSLVFLASYHRCLLGVFDNALLADAVSTEQDSG